jgi:hypothetical protein
MTTGTFNAIRSSCAWVAENALFVRIDHDRVAPYAQSLAGDLSLPPTLDADHHVVDEPDRTLAFVITLDAINFGSGYFPFLRKRPGLSGYFTIATHLKERFDAKGPFSATELVALSATDCCALFGQDPANRVAVELMERFATALNDLGHFLIDRHAGRFEGPVEQAAGSAERLVGELSRMPFYRDVRSLGDQEISFYKRAQLTAADLALALPGSALGRFDDLDQLTIFADNLVPHVLRLDGLLRYDAGLVTRIERDELIPEGYREEIEIRAAALHAVELLTADLRSTGHPTTPMRLDYLFWNRGQSPAYKAHPRHRTRTVSY